LENSDSGSAARAEAADYFDNLWQRERRKWLAGEVVPAAMNNGVTVPVDYCVTTVARLVEQPFSPVKAVEALKEQLQLPGSSNFFYPTESIHISLSGCTPRYASKEAFTGERIKRIKAVCLENLKGRQNIAMSLKGVGIIGNQVFLQVFPEDRRWAEMRRELEEAMLKIGESPITFPNKAPIHMNILRVTSGDKKELWRLLKVIEHLHTAELGGFNIAVIDFLITDFVLSPANTTLLDRIRL
jgi:hypothetical protein